MTEQDLRELIAGLALAQQKTDGQLAETDKRLASIAIETDKLLRSQQKTDEQLAKTDAQLAKTDAQLAKTDAQLAKNGCAAGRNRCTAGQNGCTAEQAGNDVRGSFQQSGCGGGGVLL